MEKRRRPVLGHGGTRLLLLSEITLIPLYLGMVGLGRIPDRWLAVNGEVADCGLDASDRGGDANDPRKL